MNTAIPRLFDPEEIAPRLLAWYGRSGREFPWRQTRDPYRIWLSEIMLQQTGVETVIPYYRRFLDRFPNVAALAAAPVEEVIEVWAGLGYYTRARNLHRAAAVVVGAHGGRFPDNLEELMNLPGVGRSTAGAILSIAFNRQAPILDGNVRRVLCRLYAYAGNPRDAAAERRLWRWAEELTPADRPDDYAQAIMDLGAAICTPRRPACRECPLVEVCEARKRGLEEELPARKKKMPIPLETRVALLLTWKGRYLVRKRPLEGMLGGLWEFPDRSVANGQQPGQVAGHLLRDLGFTGGLAEAGQLSHAYSHFRLDLRLYRGEMGGDFHVGDDGDSRWLDPGALAAIPLHGAHRKALAQLSPRDRDA